ncbi:MAG: peptidylprolyl isomerase [Actinomycetia bacterium]|nr:peptidylprolyl isomerase [Actinomycetes bacterium]
MKEASAIKRKRTTIRLGVLFAVVVVLLVLYSVFAGGDDGDEIVEASDQVTSTSEATDADATGTTVTTITTTTTAIDEAGDGECPAEDGSSPAKTQFASEPPLCIDLETKYVAEFATSEGNFDVLLDPTLDETTVNNFVFLARNHAYDGTLFHRIIDQFMVQGGDVQHAGGTGNPGYLFTGGTPAEGQYKLGSIAMANSAGPSTNGSQFFIVTGPQGVGLQPNYSLFGQVIEGLDVPLAMQAVETADGNAPIEDVVVESLTIREATADDISAYETALAG